MSKRRLAFFLAVRDWLHERTLSLCAVLALASMLTPILVLDGVANGVILAMRAKLLEDPAVLVITPISSDVERSYTASDIAQFAQLPGARFAIGRIRAMATDVTLQSDKGKSQVVHLEPCAPGEPVLSHYGLREPQDGSVPEIVLSQRAAEKLGVERGSELIAPLGRRTREGRFESFQLTLKVCDIMAANVADRSMGFVPLPVLEAIQDYHDEFAVPERGMTGRERTAERLYGSFRLYAKDLDGVESVSREFKALGIEVSTKAREIASIRSLSSSLKRVLLILAVAVGTGFLAHTLSSAQASVSRKLRMLGLLRLLGFSRLALISYPLVQIFLTTASGLLLAFLVYALVSVSIDFFFAEQSGGFALCQLGLNDTLVIVGCVLLLSAAACVRSAIKASCVDPSAVIREV
ncbi:MAG: hypothetical protein K6G15_08970 [Desulfovibrio sp.]|nr:hypothetical protein [Desulfovibrio sp.]